MSPEAVKCVWEKVPSAGRGSCSFPSHFVLTFSARAGLNLLLQTVRPRGKLCCSSGWSSPGGATQVLMLAGDGKPAWTLYSRHRFSFRWTYAVYRKPLWRSLSFNSVSVLWGFAPSITKKTAGFDPSPSFLPAALSRPFGCQDIMPHSCRNMLLLLLCPSICLNPSFRVPSGL